MRTSIAKIVGATGLAAETQNALEDYARYLLSALPSDSTQSLVVPELPGKRISYNSLAKILVETTQAKLLDKHPIVAMLPAVAGRSTQERRQHEKLKAWGLLAALVAYNRDKPVRPACRRIRRLALPDDRWLLDDILPIQDELREIVSRLSALRDDYSLEGNKPDKTKERKIAAIHVLLADLLYERNRRGPGPGGQKILPLKDYTERIAQSPVDDFLFTDGDGIEIVSDEQQMAAGGVGVDSRPLGNRYLDTVADHDYSTYLKRQVRQGRGLARTFAMRSTAPACAWEGLSPNEVQRAFAASFEAAESGCRASLWITLALLFGRTPERLWSTPKQIYGVTGPYGEYWRVTKKRIQLVSYLDLPNFRLDYQDQQIVESTYNCLLLPIPICLTEPLRKALNEVWEENVTVDELRSELKSRIQLLNTSTNNRLTSKRLSSHIHRTLTQSGEGDVVSKRIRGVDARTNYKQRYEACEQSLTQTVYRQYASSLLATIGREKEWQDSQFKTEPIGTRLKVKDDAIRHLFTFLRKHYANQGSRLDDVIERHNIYAMYVYQLLMLASGHRPVRVPMETLHSYDRISGELFICDKVVRRSNDSRTIVLPNTACLQIDRYCDHLDVLERRLRKIAPEACHIVRGAIRGESAWLFQLGRTKPDRCTVLPFDPGQVKLWLKDDWTLPLNWHRHWLRTNLTRAKQPHEYIDQFMGHEDDQPAGLSRYSGLTYAGRLGIAKCIDSLFQKLDITAIRGLR